MLGQSQSIQPQASRKQKCGAVLQPAVYENASHTRWTISQAVSDRVLKERDIDDRKEPGGCLRLELYLM